MVKPRSMQAPPAPVSLDSIPGSATDVGGSAGQVPAELIIATAAALLRQVAQWGLSFDYYGGQSARDALYAVADQVAAYRPGDLCPVCEEVDCDEDCALRPVRHPATTAAPSSLPA